MALKRAGLPSLTRMAVVAAISSVTVEEDCTLESGGVGRKRVGP